MFEICLLYNIVLLFSLPIINLSAPVDPHSSANSVASCSSSCSDSNYDSGAFSRTSSPEISTPVAARVAAAAAINTVFIPEFANVAAEQSPPFLASTPSQSSAAVNSLPLVLPPLVSPPLVLSMVRNGRGGGGSGDFAEGQLVLACLSAAGQTSAFDIERLALGKQIFITYNAVNKLYDISSGAF